MLKILCVAVFLAPWSAIVESMDAAIPQIIEKNGRHALLVDGKPFFMLGGQAHNSSGWPGMMPAVWSAIEVAHANTLEVPIYWEQIEPQPGKFDFSIADTLIKHARKHKIRLVLLWFATWKNAANHYMPEWMKLEPVKFPNIIGKNGEPFDSPSPYTKAAMEADAKAFATVMGHLKKVDPQHTVIMVQIENEAGAGGTVRDYSPEAQELFGGQVPPELLKTEILKALNRPVNATGSWQEVFGTDADEYFNAWSVARYIGFVASAGKAVNPLPFYVNAALRDPLSDAKPPVYESGGPTDNVIAIWKAAAPAIDVLAPDFYMSGTERARKVFELYNRPDNALFVPEIGRGPEYVKYLYSVIADGGIGYSPFGIDDNGSGENEAETAVRLTALAQEYSVMNPMARELAAWGFEGRIKSVVETEDHTVQGIDLGAWKAIVTFSSSAGRSAQPNVQPIGKAMIIQLGENEFIFIGTLSRLTFKPIGANSGRAWQYLKVEEGRYENGTFDPFRILNGDETDAGGPRIGAIPKVLHITLTVR